MENSGITFKASKTVKMQTISMERIMTAAREGLLEKARISPAIAMIGAGRIISVPAI